MSGVLEANIQAKLNGNSMEEWVKKIFPESSFDYLGAIDCTIEGVKCEVKSCQETIHDSNNSNGSRSGRIVLNIEQHKALISVNGDYILLVHRTGNPFLIFRFKARSLHIQNWNGNKSITWRNFIFGGLLGYEN